MYKDLPCISCPVLAICVLKKEIKCKILLKFLQHYYETSRYPHWPQMLRTLRETLRGNWCVVGGNSSIYKVEKDRKLDASYLSIL